MTQAEPAQKAAEWAWKLFNRYDVDENPNGVRSREDRRDPSNTNSDDRRQKIEPTENDRDNRQEKQACLYILS